MNNAIKRKACPVFAVIVIVAVLWNPTSAMAADGNAPFDGAKTDLARVRPLRLPHGRADLGRQSRRTRPRDDVQRAAAMHRGRPENSRRPAIPGPGGAVTGTTSRRPKSSCSRRGFHVAYITANARLRPDKQWDAWYAFPHGEARAVEEAGLHRHEPRRRIRLHLGYGPSRPGLLHLRRQSGRQSGRSSMRLADLASDRRACAARLRQHRSASWAGSRLAIESIYQQFGGRITMMIKEGAGHHPHSLRDPKPIADFIEQSVRRHAAAPPAFVGSRSRRTHFYSIENSYRNFREEGRITCRGPRFAECYDRYAFELAGVEGSVNVIVPKTAAPGKPWVYPGGVRRPGRGGGPGPAGQGFSYRHRSGGLQLRRPAAAPLGRGVQAPRRPRLLRIKPVMEGAGGAAGEVYAWAIAESGQGFLRVCREPRSSQRGVERLDLRKPRPAGEGRRAAVARLRQRRSLARQPDPRCPAAIQGTGRTDHGHRPARRGALSPRAQGPEAGRRFHSGKEHSVRSKPVPNDLRAGLR